MSVMSIRPESTGAAPPEMKIPERKGMLMIAREFVVTTEAAERSVFPPKIFVKAGAETAAGARRRRKNAWA